MPKSQPQFSLGTFSAAGAPGFPAIVLEDKVLALQGLQPLLDAKQLVLIDPNSILNLLNTWEHNFSVLKQAVAKLSEDSELSNSVRAKMVDVNTLHALPPVDLPRQVFCAGANYFKHVVDYICARGPGVEPETNDMSSEELRAYAFEIMTRRREVGDPYIFNKPVSSICGANDPIKILPIADKPDWELEMAVVIGKPAFQLTRENAMDCVAGYAIANDLTNRGQSFRTDKDMKAMGSDWLSGKSSPGYLPFGPYLVPSEFVDDPMALTIDLALNGETKQHESTSDMIINIPRLLEYLTARVQLLPGDVLCTGSPAGNGKNGTIGVFEITR